MGYVTSLEGMTPLNRVYRVITPMSQNGRPFIPGHNSIFLTIVEATFAPDWCPMRSLPQACHPRGIVASGAVFARLACFTIFFFEHGKKSISNKEVIPRWWIISCPRFVDQLRSPQNIWRIQWRQWASCRFHSMSKGYYGECGLRGDFGDTV